MIRFSPSRFALSYIALCVLALALFAIPLWYGYRANLGTFRAYVPGAEMQRLVDVFHRDGAQAAAAAVESYLPSMPRDEVMIFVDPQKQRLAGNLPAWPAEVPDVPGTYGLVIGLGGEASMRVVTSHVTLPGGYYLLMGRESVRFDSLVARFWYGIAGAVAIVLTLGLAFAWLLRRERGQLEALVAQRTAALRLSEERYARVMHASEDGFWEWIVASDEFYASPRMLALYGLPPDTVFRSRADFLSRCPFYPEDLELWRKSVAAHLAGQSARVNIELRAKVQGKTCWIRLTAICLRDASGAEERWTGSVSDVTERRRAQEALRRSEERYARAMEGSDAGHWDWNIVTDEMFVSERAREMLALPAGSLPATRAEIMALAPMHPEDRQDMHDQIAASIAAGRHERDYRVIPRPGEVRWLRSRGKVYRDAHGAAVRMTGSLTDITERKLAADALRASEERYSLAMEASEEGYVDVNIDTGEFVTSERLNEIFGFAPGTRFRGRSDFLSQFRFYGNDAETYHRALRAIEADGGPDRYQFEFRIVLPSGEVRWLWTRGKVTRDADGRARRRIGVFSDITPHKRAEEALRASEERYERAMLAAEAGFWDWDVAQDKYYVSPRLLEMAGLPAGTAIAGRADFQARVPLHPDDLAKWQQAIKVLFASGRSRLSAELRVIVGAETRWYRLDGMCFRDAAGNVVRWTGSSINVTDRKVAEEALRRSEAALRLSEERYALAMEASEEGHFDWNVRTDEIFVSAHIKKVFGFPPDAQFRTRNDLIARVPYHPADDAWLTTMARDTLTGNALRHEFEYRILRDGQVRWLHAHWKILRDAAGDALRVIGVVTDITDRKRAADELRESEQRFRALTELSSDWYWRQDENLRFTYLSSQVDDLTGYSGESSLGKTRWEIANMTPLTCSWAQHQAVLAARRPFRDLECRRVGPDGTVRYLSMSGAPIFDEQGRFRGYQGIGRNITERKRIEEELRARQEMLDLAQKSAQAIAFEWRIGADGPDQNRWSPELAAMYGVRPQSYDGGFEQWKKLVHPEDWPAVREAIKHAQCTGEVSSEYRVVHPDGSVHWLQAKGRMFFDAEGKPARMVGFMHDVTERRRAEEEVKRMERQLRQAQRLEAMGTLAGGIAHDFNNILGAILGYGEMALRDAAKGSRLRRDLDSILTAGERGRALVDRVLAFSRSGVGERVAVPVEKVVREALDLVSARLPPNVTLHAKLHAASAAMLGDPTQVHQVLMNLATNAVQAMPGGGTLRVSLDTARADAARTTTIGSLAPADYVVLKVADTGTGIAPETLERIFDPFFTTKEVGTGTGLGLSLVHGIVSEVGGAIDVASKVGAGSTFTVYLPRAGDAPQADDSEERALPRGGGERVLIVDDEEPLVKLATRTLEELGYAPVGFTSSAAALAAFRADPQRFDALITDERMPEMSGSALIREVRGIRNGIPIVLMSGYVGGKVATLAREAGAEEVLKKPLSASDLAASLARVLNS